MLRKHRYARFARKMISATDRSWMSVASDMDLAKRYIYTPYVCGEWKPSTEILDQFSFTGKIVLDFGCGVGRNLEYIIDRSPSTVYGYDHAKMLSLTAQYLGEKAGRFVPVRAYSFADIAEESIDIVWCSFVLQHIEPRQLNFSLEWLARVMKPSADLVVLGRDCGDPPDCRPVKPSIAARFDSVRDEAFATKDVYPHSLSVWRKR